MSAPPPDAAMCVALMGTSSVAIAVTCARAVSLRAQSEPDRREDARVGLQHQHVPGQIGAVAIAVVEPATQAVLLVGEQHDADRPPRPEVQLLQQTRHFPRRHRAAAVVGRAGADVPRVEVAADDDDLFGLLAPADFGDHVGRIRVGQHLGAHRQLETQVLAARGHARQAVGVLDG